MSSTGRVEGAVTQADHRLSFGARLRQLASEAPEAVALICVDPGGAESAVTRRELERRSNQFARMLLEYSPKAARFVLVALPNCLDHVLVTLAAWKLGACVLPLNARSTARELADVADLVGPALFVSDVAIESDKVDRLQRAQLSRAARYNDEPLPDRVANPGKAIASGGSTGKPKVIVDPTYWAMEPGELLRGTDVINLRAGQVQLICGPLFHNTPFTFLAIGLFERHRIVLMERFDAGLALRLVEAHRIEWAALVPTMMKRIAEHPGFREADLSTIEGVFHTAAPCPPWLKDQWIERLGGSRIVELYGASEEIGFTIIRGDEWLAHRGSVGRPFNTEIRILRSDGTRAAPGEVGEVYLRRLDIAHESFRYLGGATARRTPDGFTSVGDLGSVDEAGFLYLSDRRADLIISGGANVYPAEVEAELGRCPGVRDVAVIGLPDVDWGQRVHAVIEVDPAGPAPTEQQLREFCAARLAPYKRPKSYSVGVALPRNEAGKLRRTALVDVLGASQSSERGKTGAT